MKRRLSMFIAVIVVAGLLSGAAAAAPSFLSTTGNILTPNDSVLAPGDFSANFHALNLDDNTPTVIGANVGVTESLELGIARFDPDVRALDEETLLNAKYRLLPETASRPSVLIGVVDATGDLDRDDDPGFYIVLGKNLTSIATGLSGEPVQPIRGFIGVGTGIYNGVFLGLDWTFSAKSRIIVEYINELNIKGAFGEESVFNAGLRFALTDALRGDLALINGEDFGFGISYTKTGL